MPLDLFPMPYIDEAVVPDHIVKECKSAYEKHGKERMYVTLNTMLYDIEPNISRRNLYLYSKTMF